MRCLLCACPLLQNKARKEFLWELVGTVKLGVVDSGSVSARPVLTRQTETCSSPSTGSTPSPRMVKPVTPGTSSVLEVSSGLHASSVLYV